MQGFSEPRSAGGQSKAFSTVRGYQLALLMFCDYLTDQGCTWVALCVERFDAAPTQILREWNTVVHVIEIEGRPRRRALIYDEVLTPPMLVWMCGCSSRRRPNTCCLVSRPR